MLVYKIVIQFQDHECEFKPNQIQFNKKKTAKNKNLRWFLYKNTSIIEIGIINRIDLIIFFYHQNSGYKLWLVNQMSPPITL